MEKKNACCHVKEHKKLGQKLMSKVTLHFVWDHLSKKQTVSGRQIHLFYLSNLGRIFKPELYTIHNIYKC